MLPDYIHPRPIPKLKGLWEGLKIRTVKELSTSQMILPIGTICTVTRNYGGLYMRSDPCELCGVSMIITKVPEKDVELISSRCDKCRVPMHADEHFECMDEEKGTYICWNCGFKGLL